MSDIHLRYAEEIAALSGNLSPGLRRALATIRREDFLPPGPWMIETVRGIYYRSEDADPRHVLHGVGVAIDLQRGLNNANPIRFAEQMALLDPRPGETVFHVGAAFGYFSALLAELVAPEGRVLAAEIDTGLRERARINLAGWPRVEVTGDALVNAPPAFDVLYSSAGLGTLPEAWLAALRPGGRMLVPLTDGHDHGMVFLLHKIAEGQPWTAKMISFTRHYPCLGSRAADDLAALSAAMTQAPTAVASLRRDRHDPEQSCWLHRDEWCLSTRPATR